MKKIFIIINILLFAIITIFTINTQKTYAGRGCCSWHGGQSYCGNNGKWICKDGTESPSCSCSTNANEKSENNENGNDNDTVYNAVTGQFESNQDTVIEHLKDEKQELIEKNKKLQNDKNILFTSLMLLGFTFILYIISKKKEN